MNVNLRRVKRCLAPVQVVKVEEAGEVKRITVGRSQPCARAVGSGVLLHVVFCDHLETTRYFVNAYLAENTRKYIHVSGRIAGWSLLLASRGRHVPERTQ